MPKAESQMISDTILIRGSEIPIKRGQLPEIDLIYFEENPRIFSIIRADGRKPTQKQIETHLQKQPHVKHLVNTIEKNGGLIDPVIVRDGDMTVLEGNSRLAAYRVLAKRDPIKWGMMKAKLLPKDISDSAIFSLLGEYHIIGKKDWLPFEQAAYLHRRHNNHKVDISELKDEIGLSANEIKLMIGVIDFMAKHKVTDSNKYSYYYEYLKSTAIRKVRMEESKFDRLIVDKINSGEIERAADLRSGLKKICQTGGRVLNRFISGQDEFSLSVEKANTRNPDNAYYSRLHRFRQWIADLEIESELARLDGSIANKCKFEIKKISDRMNRLRKILKVD